MKIYTKTGDKGTTSLADGTRVEKNDPRVDAYGTIDELISVIAYLRDSINVEFCALVEFRDDLLIVLNKLMNLSAILASGECSKKEMPEISDADIINLEKRIDYLNDQVTKINKFTIPGGHPLVSLTHLCRTICRRTERCVVSAVHHTTVFVPENGIVFLNRLSDYLYLLGRKLCDEMGAKEEYWDPNKKTDK